MTTDQHEQEQPQSDAGDSADLSLREVMGSVLAAGFGVQSKENKVRDFTHGKPLQFIITGVILTLALLGSLVAVVALVV